MSNSKQSTKSLQSKSSQAFRAFRRAIEDGEVNEFLSLVTEDFHFSVPLPFEDWKNEQRDKHRLEKLVRFERETLQVHLTPLI